MQSRAEINPQMQRYPHRQAQMHPCAQMESYRQTQRQPNTQTSPQAQLQAHGQFPTKPPTQSHSGSEAAVSLKPNTSAEAALHHSQSHHPDPDPDCAEPFQCVRTVRFSEKPCTPCMRRRQGAKASKSQELRCRFRDSYQAAIQNPVPFGQEKDRGNMLAVVEEGGDFSHWEKRALETNAGRKVPGTRFDSGMQNMSPSSVSGALGKESGEKNTVPYWKTGDTNAAPCKDYRGTYVSKVGGPPEQTAERTTVHFREPRDSHNVNGTSLNDPNQSDATSAKHHQLPLTSTDGLEMKMTLKPRERLQSRNNSKGVGPNFPQSLSAPQSRHEFISDGRCSSLSTAVVDTSEKCALVIVEGQSVRRRDDTGSCAEIPQLHVVKCKNSTAFGLVSPKINRKQTVVPGTK